MSSTVQSPNVGLSVRRKADLRLITGKGRFGDDVNPPRQAYSVLVRAPHAPARIRLDIANREKADRRVMTPRNKIFN